MRAQETTQNSNSRLEDLGFGINIKRDVVNHIPHGLLKPRTIVHNDEGINVVD
jgi:hypothetical protein